MTRVVLASASPGRRKVLRQAGIDPLVIVSGVDEDAVIARHKGQSPDDVVRALAQAKADDVLSRVPPDLAADCVVIGADSMLLVDGQLCGKPRTAEGVMAQWNAMAGRSGELLTGHCVAHLKDGALARVESVARSTTVYFGKPSTSELEWYIRTGEPLRVAGGFTINGGGGWFVDRIAGDPSNVIGLSLPLIRELSRRCGITITDLCNFANSD
jgi:septum formation protein